MKKLLFIIGAGLLVANFAFANWSEPSQSPPGGNVPAPINVGTSLQIKNGIIGAKAFCIYQTLTDANPSCLGNSGGTGGTGGGSANWPWIFSPDGSGDIINQNGNGDNVNIGNNGGLSGLLPTKKLNVRGGISTDDLYASDNICLAGQCGATWMDILNKWMGGGSNAGSNGNVASGNSGGNSASGGGGLTLDDVVKNGRNTGRDIGVGGICLTEPDNTIRCIHSWSEISGTTNTTNITNTGGPVAGQPGSNEWTTPGTYDWTVPNGITKIKITACAAGGAGGAAPGGLVSGGVAAGGGGGGSISYNSTYSVSPGKSLRIIIGTGGQPSNDQDLGVVSIDGVSYGGKSAPAGSVPARYIGSLDTDIAYIPAAGFGQTTSVGSLISLTGGSGGPRSGAYLGKGGTGAGDGGSPGLSGRDSAYAKGGPAGSGDALYPTSGGGGGGAGLGNGGAGGQINMNGLDGIRCGGGGGGGARVMYSYTGGTVIKSGGGKGGDGYVKIEWGF